MGVEINRVPVTVVAVRIDDKKLSMGMLEQLPVYSLLNYITDEQRKDAEWKYGGFITLCRISSVPVIKGLRAHLSRTYGNRGHVDRVLSEYAHTEHFGLWAVDDTLYLHPCGHSPNHFKYDPSSLYSNVHESWQEELNDFDEAFNEVPLALIGV